MIIFEADDPLVVNGTYDREGYKPGERGRIAKARERHRHADMMKGPMMFTTENLPVLLKSVTLKQDDDHERFAHCKFILEPLLPALAHELGEEVFDHLFDAQSVPRREVSDIAFDLMFVKQHLIARTHPELAPAATLSHVSIDSVRVTRPDPDKPRLKLEFVCVVPLLDRAVIEFVVYSFGNPLYLTFEAMQRALPEMTAPITKRAKRHVPAGDDPSSRVHTEH